LLSNGTVVAWTDGVFQTNLSPALTNIIGISAGLALKANGMVMDFSNSTNVPAGLTNIVAVASGSQHSLVLKSDGTVVAWGTYERTVAPDIFPAFVPAGLTNAVAIAGGMGHSYALLSDGTVAAWGDNTWGELNIPADLTNCTAIAAGIFTGLAAKSDGAVDEWSDGDGTSTIFTNAVAVTAGLDHNVVLKADGTVNVWGDNTVGQNNVPPGLSNVVAVSAGYTFTMALVGNGPPVTKVNVLHPSRTGTNFSLQIPTQNNHVYRLEYKLSLTDSNWTALPLIAGTGKLQTLSDSAVAGTARYYRVRTW
jgi:hypothetical protein